MKTSKVCIFPERFLLSILVLGLSACAPRVSLEKQIAEMHPQTTGCEVLERRRQEYNVAGLERDARAMSEQLVSCTRREYREHPLDQTRALAYENARKELSQAYLRTGELDAAAELARDLIRGPEQCLHDCTGVFDNLIEIYSQQKRYGELMPLLEQRLASQQQRGASAAELAATELQMAEALNGTKQYQNALAMADRALDRLTPTDVESATELKARLLLVKGRNLIRLGRFAEANQAHDLARVVILQNPRSFRPIYLDDLQNVRNYYHRSRDFGRAQQYDELLQTIGG